MAVRSSDGYVGGFRCPYPWCDYRDVIQPFVDDHVAREHPEPTSEEEDPDAE